MDYHPIDVRHHNWHGKRPTPSKYIILPSQLRGTPPLPALLSLDPYESIEARTADRIRTIELKAVDLIAHHVAADIAAEEPTMGIYWWIREAPREAVDRFSVGLALHAQKLWTLSNYSARARELLMTYLLRPEGMCALPTADRLSSNKHTQTLNVPPPEVTLALREMNWRDAAGRNIDTFLIEGAFSARNNPIPPLNQDVDRTVATRIDSRLPGAAFSLEVSIEYWGVVLSHSHRQALANLQEDMQRGSPPGQAAEFYRLTNMVPMAATPEAIQDLLDMERANRSMSQRASAAEQEHAPCESSMPPTL